MWVCKTRPTGSGSAVTSRIPCAIPAMRSFVSFSLSSMTGEICSFADAISSALASRIASCRASSASAMAFSAAFFCSVVRPATSPFAALAASSISFIDVPPKT